MTYFELIDQFWRLDAECSFSAGETRLYFYLLNQFNSSRWAPKIYRRTNQVAADLNADAKTIDASRRGLEGRYLVHYVAGNKSMSATWSLQMDGKNSRQSAQNTVDIDRNNSGTSSPNPANRVEMDGKNSGPIRNRSRLEVEEENKKKAGEAAEEITLAPLPAKEKEVSAPRCEAPPKSEAAQLPEALAAEAKALANEIAPIWDLSEIKNQPKWARIHSFTRRMAVLGRLPEVRQQLAGYQGGHLRPGVRPHQLDKWLGSAADDYAQGEWCGCDWPSVAAKARARPGDPAAQAPVTRVATNTKPQASASWR
ncbi:MAG: hypothetical protein ACRYFV_01720 [Janthinobacterium lividum]